MGVAQTDKVKIGELMNKMLLSATIGGILILMPLAACNAEETKTVEWYLTPENKAALEAKLAECQNNPGELKDTPNCINARVAADKRATSGTFEKVREPAVPKFAKP